MNLYVALDVSLEFTAVCVMDEEGELVLERKVASDPAAIAGLLFQLPERPSCVGHLGDQLRIRDRHSRSPPIASCECHRAHHDQKHDPRRRAFTSPCSQTPNDIPSVARSPAEQSWQVLKKSGVTRLRRCFATANFGATPALAPAVAE